ncbi:hypothetical protein, partial [Pontibacter liquoris]|uniref:hypothetical protein n=1 Tax=Pontibacter liquoris TaxID=2905677 RepID=UPI001FA79A8A
DRRSCVTSLPFIPFPLKRAAKVRTFFQLASAGKKKIEYFFFAFLLFGSPAESLHRECKKACCLADLVKCVAAAFPNPLSC